MCLNEFPTIWDVLAIIATAVLTAFAQTYFRNRSEREKVYKGFLREIRQNIRFAEYNIKKLEKFSSKRTFVSHEEFLFFQEYFYNLGTTSAYFLDLPYDLQVLLHEIYIKQHEVGFDIKRLSSTRFDRELSNTIEKEIKENLLPKLKEAEKHLEKVLDR